MGGPDGVGSEGSLRGAVRSPWGRGARGSTFPLCLLISVIPRPEGLSTSSHPSLLLTCRAGTLLDGASSWLAFLPLLAFAVFSPSTLKPAGS